MPAFKTITACHSSPYKEPTIPSLIPPTFPFDSCPQAEEISHQRSAGTAAVQVIPTTSGVPDYPLVTPLPPLDFAKVPDLVSSLIAARASGSSIGARRCSTAPSAKPRRLHTPLTTSPPPTSLAGPRAPRRHLLEPRRPSLHREHPRSSRRRRHRHTPAGHAVR